MQQDNTKHIRLSAKVGLKDDNVNALEWPSKSLPFQGCLSLNTQHILCVGPNDAMGALFYVKVGCKYVYHWCKSLLMIPAQSKSHELSKPRRIKRWGLSSVIYHTPYVATMIYFGLIYWAKLSLMLFVLLIKTWTLTFLQGVLSVSISVGRRLHN